MLGSGYGSQRQNRGLSLIVSARTVFVLAPNLSDNINWNE